MKQYQVRYGRSVPMSEPRSFMDWQGLVAGIRRNGVRRVREVRHFNGRLLGGPEMLELWKASASEG